MHTNKRARKRNAFKFSNHHEILAPLPSVVVKIEFNAYLKIYILSAFSLYAMKENSAPDTLEPGYHIICLDVCVFMEQIYNLNLTIFILFYFEWVYLFSILFMCFCLDVARCCCICIQTLLLM